MSVVKFSVTYIQSILQITSVSTCSPLSVSWALVHCLYLASPLSLLFHLLIFACSHRLQFPLSKLPCLPSLVHNVAQQHQMLFQLRYRVWGWWNRRILTAIFQTMSLAVLHGSSILAQAGLHQRCTIYNHCHRYVSSLSRRSTVHRCVFRSCCHCRCLGSRCCRRFRWRNILHQLAANTYSNFSFRKIPPEYQCLEIRSGTGCLELLIVGIV